MQLSSSTRRTTKITLSAKEYSDAIRQYLASRGVADYNQHLKFEQVDTRSDNGVELSVTIENYNNGDNICKNPDNV